MDGGGGKILSDVDQYIFSTKPEVREEEKDSRGNGYHRGEGARAGRKAIP